MAALLVEGQFPEQLEKQRFAYKPVRGTVEGTKYHRNCWSVGFSYATVFPVD